MNKKYIALLIATCLLLTAIFFQPLHTNFDDSNYVLYAEQINNGTYNPAESPYAYGILMPATVAASIQIFGANNFAISLPSIIEYIALILIIYAVIKRNFDEQTAFYVALAAAFSTFIFLYSSRVLPDLLLGVLIGLSILEFEMGREETALIFFAGIFLGLTIFVKLGGFLFTIFMIISLFLTENTEKAMLFTIGWLAVIVIYVFVLNSFIPFNLAVQSYSNTQVHLNNATLYGNIYNIYATSFGYKQTKSNFFSQVFPLGLFLIFAMVGSVIKKINLYIVFFWLFYWYMFFGTESFTHWTFITIVSRYFIWVAVPMAILLAYFIEKAYQFTQTAYNFNQQDKVLMFWLMIVLIIASNLPLYWYFILNRGI